MANPRNGKRRALLSVRTTLILLAGLMCGAIAGMLSYVGNPSLAAVTLVGAASMGTSITALDRWIEK